MANRFNMDDVLNWLCRECYMVDGEWRRPYRKTASIITGLGHTAGEGEINDMRKLCNYMVDRGLVERTGDRKFQWRVSDYSFRQWAGEEKPEEKPPPYKPVYQEEELEPEPPLKLADDKQIKALEARVKALEETERQHIATTEALLVVNKKLVEGIAELRQEVNSTRTVEVKLPHKKKPVSLKGVMPSVFDKVLDLAVARKNILLVGPAGCGKTFIGELIAKALEMEFSAIVCTTGMSESHLIGSENRDLSTGTSRFRTTEFLLRFGEGGVQLLDELDGADANVLLCINSALANGYINTPANPKKSRIDKHDDFVCIGTANTFGRGANRQYAGRNQLDEATIDRFRIGIIECDYDKAVERYLCPDDDLLNKMWDIRGKIEAAGLRKVLSTRFIRDAYDMKTGAGWKIGDILETFFSGWTKDEMSRVGHNPQPPVFGSKI